MGTAAAAAVRPDDQAAAKELRQIISKYSPEHQEAWKNSGSAITMPDTGTVALFDTPEMQHGRELQEQDTGSTAAEYVGEAVVYCCACVKRKCCCGGITCTTTKTCADCCNGCPGFL